MFVVCFLWMYWTSLKFPAAYCCWISCIFKHLLGLMASDEFHNLRTKMVLVVEQTFKRHAPETPRRAIHVGTMPDNELSILQCAFIAAWRQKRLIHRVVDGARSSLSTWRWSFFHSPVQPRYQQRAERRKKSAQACAPRTSQGPLKAMMPLPQPSSGPFHLGEGMEKRCHTADSNRNTYRW